MGYDHWDPSTDGCPSNAWVRDPPPHACWGPLEPKTVSTPVRPAERMDLVLQPRLDAVQTLYQGTPYTLGSCPPFFRHTEHNQLSAVDSHGLDPDRGQQRIMTSHSNVPWNEGRGIMRPIRTSIGARAQRVRTRRAQHHRKARGYERCEKTQVKESIRLGSVKLDTAA